MKFYLASLSSIALIVCCSCSSTPTHVDKGPLQARTFSFVKNGAMPRAEFSENREVIHGMIQEAITDNLASRGLSRVQDQGDVTVAYLIIVGNNVSTMSINDYFGYDPDAIKLADKAHAAYTTDNKNPNAFEAGTLVIDLLDTKTFKLLNRTYVVRPLLRSAPDNVRKARIREAVDEALQDIRVAKN